MKTLLKAYTKNGFNIKLRYEFDESPDFSFIGRYSNKWEHGAIKTGRTGRYFEYFIPANPEYATQDFEQMEAINRGDYGVYGLMLTVERAGVELGNASVWNVITEDITKEVENYLQDLEADALKEARQALKALAPTPWYAQIAAWWKGRAVNFAVTATLWAFPLAVLAWSLYLNVFRPR